MRRRPRIGHFSARSRKNPIASSAIRSATSGPTLVSVAMASLPIASASGRDDCRSSGVPAGGSDGAVPGAAGSGSVGSGPSTGVSTVSWSVTIAAVSAVADGSMAAGDCAAVSTSITSGVSASITAAVSTSSTVTGEVSDVGGALPF